MLSKARLLCSITAVLFCFSVSTALADTACPASPNPTPAGWISFGSKGTAKSPQCAFVVAAVGMPASNSVFCYYSNNQILMSINPAQATSQNWGITTCLKHPQVQGGRYTVCCDQSISSCNFLTSN